MERTQKKPACHRLYPAIAQNYSDLLYHWIPMKPWDLVMFVHKIAIRLLEEDELTDAIQLTSWPRWHGDGRFLETANSPDHPKRKKKQGCWEPLLTTGSPYFQQSTHGSLRLHTKDLIQSGLSGGKHPSQLAKVYHVFFEVTTSGGRSGFGPKRRNEEVQCVTLVGFNRTSFHQKKRLERQQFYSCTSFTLALSLSCGKDQPVSSNDETNRMRFEWVKVSEWWCLTSWNWNCSLVLLQMLCAQQCSTDGWILGSGDPLQLSNLKAKPKLQVLSSENLDGFLQLLSRLLCCEWVHETKEAREDVCT